MIDVEKKQLHVLLVDDDDGIRQVASLALRRIGGFEVTEAASGADALDKIGNGAFDAIILDVMMPQMDGPSTLLQLRQLKNGAEVPVIFLTAKVLPRELSKLRELGVLGVLTKPFDPITLSAHIEDLMNREAQ
jgi:two-component system OmpR family response regulator